MNMNILSISLLLCLLTLASCGKRAYLAGGTPVGAVAIACGNSRLCQPGDLYKTRSVLVNLEQPDRSAVIDITYFTHARFDPGTIVSVSSTGGLIRRGNLIDCGGDIEKPPIEIEETEVKFNLWEGAQMASAEFLRYENIPHVSDSFSEVKHIEASFTSLVKQTIPLDKIYSWLYRNVPSLNAVCLNWIREPKTYLVHSSYVLKGLRYIPKTWRFLALFSRGHGLKADPASYFPEGTDLLIEKTDDQTVFIPKGERYIAIANPLPLDKYSTQTRSEFAEDLESFYDKHLYGRR